jgi:hypothetical protein
MGLSTQSSNFALPTSRLILILKRRSYKKRVQSSGGTLPEHITSDQLEYLQTKRGSIWVSVRFINRLAEAGYRQIISLYYQLHGYVVVYDRHFLFEAALDGVQSDVEKKSRLDRLYYWILSNLFPKPGLVIFLDAPVEVLYERKKETTPAFLTKQRGAYLEQGKKHKNFIRVDATQTIDKVLEEVTQHIKEFFDSKYHQGSAGAR